MSTTLTLKQTVASVWQKFMEIVGHKSIKGIGDDTLTGAIVELNSNLKKNYVQGGIANTSSLNGYFRSVHITFPTRYKATPNVVATVMNYQNSVIDARLCTLVKNMSTTGADIYVADQSGEIGGMGYQVQWIAVGEID